MSKWQTRAQRTESRARHDAVADRRKRFGAMCYLIEAAHEGNPVAALLALLLYLQDRIRMLEYAEQHPQTAGLVLWMMGLRQKSPSITGSSAT